MTEQGDQDAHRSLLRDSVSLSPFRSPAQMFYCETQLGERDGGATSRQPRRTDFPEARAGVFASPAPAALLSWPRCLESPFLTDEWIASHLRWVEELQRL